VARHLVRLKLSLLRNGLVRTGWQGWLGLVLGVLGGLPLAVGGFLLLAIAPRAEPEIGAPLVEVVFLVLFVGWLLFPLFTFAAEATLDPARLVLLPLRPRQLAVGLLAASCVGLAPVFTLAALAGAVVGFAPLGPGLLLAVAAVLVEFALCVVGSRALVTALSRILRTRRARDLTLVLVSVGAILLNLALQLGSRLLSRLDRQDVESLRQTGRAVGWLPPVLAARALVDAGQGRPLVAAAELLPAVALLPLLAWWWWRSLDRVLTSVEGAGRGGPGRGRAPTLLFPRLVAPLLPSDQRGAVAAKELRYMARHPRLRVAWLINGLMGIALVVAVALFEPFHRPEAVLAAVVLVYLTSQNNLNQFGTDGPAYWTNVAAGADPRADLVGKNLATALAGLAGTAVIAVALAAVTGGWLWVPLTLCLAAAVLAVALGVADVVSVRFAFYQPDVSTNLWANQGLGQGCLVGAVQMVAFTGQAVLLLPVAAAVAAGRFLWPPALVLAGPFAVGYGYLLWRVGLGIGAGWLRDHQPELLTELGPRKAA
jgi:ABC-2 type transport system permease protein